MNDLPSQQSNDKQILIPRAEDYKAFEALPSEFQKEH